MRKKLPKSAKVAIGVAGTAIGGLLLYKLFASQLPVAETSPLYTPPRILTLPPPSPSTSLPSVNVAITQLLSKISAAEAAYFVAIAEYDNVKIPQLNAYATIISNLTPTVNAKATEITNVRSELDVPQNAINWLNWHISELDRWIVYYSSVQAGDMGLSPPAFVSTDSAVNGLYAAGLIGLINLGGINADKEISVARKAPFELQIQVINAKIGVLEAAYTPLAIQLQAATNNYNTYKIATDTFYTLYVIEKENLILQLKAELATAKGA